MRLPLLLVLASTLSLAAEKPKLAVLIVIDQMAAQTFDQRVPLATAGIKRMIAEGTWVKAATYETAPTVTAVGHATLATGTWPETHGVVSNEWFDEALGRVTYACEDARFQTVGRAPKPRDCTSPWMMKAPTIGDTFKAFHKDAKNVAVSAKHRAAIFPGGASADAAVWVDAESGLFVTSSFYGAALPAWLTDVNALIVKHIAAGGLQLPLPGGGFTGKAPLPATARPALDGGGDLVLSERHDLQPMYEYAEVEAALAAVKALALGKDDAPDFLSVSFSGHDFLAHAFGPDAPQMTDDFLRIDAQVGRLLAGLDQLVGKGKYVVALSADHGGGQNPELLKARKIDAGRVDGYQQVRAALETEADAALGPGDWFAGFWTPGLFATPATKAKLLTATARIVAAARKIEGVAECIPYTELQKPGSYGALGTLYRHGAYPGRSPDFIIVPRAYWTYGTRDAAAHGTPYWFDRAVPLVLFGGGVKKGELAEAQVVDVAPTLAALVGAPPPPATVGRALIR